MTSKICDIQSGRIITQQPVIPETNTISNLVDQTHLLVPLRTIWVGSYGIHLFSVPCNPRAFTDDTANKILIGR